MMIFGKLNHIIILATTAILSISAANAQSFKLPKAHNAEHKGLIAKQQNIGNQISVEETKAFVDNLFKEEEEPEMDIYTEGWESKRVNAYVGMEVPDTKVIDVSDFAMPTPGYVTSPYGYRPRFKRVHKGIDLKLQVGDTVRAAFDGRVRLTNFEGKGYGYYVILRHPNGLETVYGHLSRFLVKPDQYVKAGDPIALGGNTGRSFGSHLHFETRYMGYPINPAAIFDFANQTVHTDEFTFNKQTYTQARNFDPSANQEYARQYLASAPQKSTSSKKQSSTANKAKSYTVKRGDSLSRIASRNGMTVRQLCKLNGLSTKAKLTPGTKIRLR
jgi:murein DD-endopeptidase MepM/ murein hydrolase activator NlpD